MHLEQIVTYHFGCSLGAPQLWLNIMGKIFMEVRRILGRTPVHQVNFKVWSSGKD